MGSEPFQVSDIKGVPLALIIFPRLIPGGLLHTRPPILLGKGSENQGSSPCVAPTNPFMSLPTRAPLLLGVHITGMAQKKTVNTIFTLEIANIMGHASRSSRPSPYPLVGLHSLGMPLWGPSSWVQLGQTAPWSDSSPSTSACLIPPL